LAFGGFERESFVGNDAASGESLAFGDDEAGVESPSFFWFRLDLDLVDVLVVVNNSFTAESCCFLSVAEPGDVFLRGETRVGDSPFFFFLLARLFFFFLLPPSSPPPWMP
jgi:hypothetical protein